MSWAKVERQRREYLGEENVSGRRERSVFSKTVWTSTSSADDWNVSTAFGKTEVTCCSLEPRERVGVGVRLSETDWVVSGGRAVRTGWRRIQTISLAWKDVGKIKAVICKRIWEKWRCVVILVCFLWLGLLGICFLGGTRTYLKGTGNSQPVESSLTVLRFWESPRVEIK